MPFSPTASQLADLADTVPGTRAVHEVPMPPGRGLAFKRLVPAFWRLRLTREFRDARRIRQIHDLLTNAGPREDPPDDAGIADVTPE